MRNLIYDINAVKAAREALAVQRGWTALLAPLDWHHAVDLTFEFERSEPTMVRHFDNYRRRLENIAGQRVTWFRISEKGPNGGRMHIHALLSGTRGVSTRAIQRRWMLGFTRVREYDPALGAAYYLTEEVNRPDIDYDMSRILPGLRGQHGSAHARAASKWRIPARAAA